MIRGGGEYVHFISKDKGTPIMLDGWLYEGQRHKIDQCIHWFEFCWIILNKLSSKITPMQAKHCIEILGTICFNKSSLQHPVDYLYEEFKKLKLK
jgi:hypothetical protein